MGFQDYIDLAVRIVEAAGVAVILVGSVVAAVPLFGKQLLGGRTRYQVYRRNLGRAILLGLELLVGADIIRTVSHVPTLTSVVVLGIIVLIRTFLSITLSVEIEGRWPWSKRAESEPVKRQPSPIDR